VANVMIKKIFLAKKLAKNGVFDSKQSKNLIITLVFKKNAIFCKNWDKTK
jgi:hypothetical protein